MVPHVALWIHELQRCMRTSFLEPCWMHEAWIQFPVSWSGFCSHFARQSRVHMHFQLSPRILNEFFVFFLLRINEADALHSSSIIEFWLLVYPSLFFSLLSGFPNVGPYFDPHIVWSSGRLNFCQSLPGPHISL